MKKRIGLKRTVCLALAMLTVLCTVVSSYSAAALDLSFGKGEVDNEGKFVYLSTYLSDNSVAITKKTGWGNILADITPESQKLAMRIEGQALTFEKGIWAHATSTIVFNLSKIEGYEKYKQFSAFVGLNTTANSASSVRFTISTSTDNKTWKEQYKKEVIGTADGEQVIFDLDDAVYLKLEADDMGGNGSDHSIYGDAMLLTEDYEDPMKGPRLEAIDEYIRDMVGDNKNPELTPELKLVIMQRDFIANFGEYTLAKYVYEHPENREFIEDVLLPNEHGLLEEYVFGGRPSGTYSASMDVFAELYDLYGSDLEEEENGDLYRRMMVTLSLTHSQLVRSFIADVDGEGKALDQSDPSSPNVSNPARRYEVFKELYNDGKLREMFTYLQVPFLRLVMSSRMGDDEYEWCNKYYTSRGSWYYATWIRYSFDNSFVRDQYHDPEQAKKYQEIYGFSDDILYRTSLDRRYPAQWMVFADFGTCGIQAPLGVNLWNSIGIPAFQIGEPGHAALSVGPNWDGNKKQITSWITQNSGTSWSRANIGVYPPFGWGRGYYAYGSNLCYIWLCQYAANDWDNYKAAEYYIKLAECYGDDDGGRKTRIELYEKALEKQNCNLDAFLKMFEVYKAENNLEKLMELGERVIKCYGWDGKEEKGDQEIFAVPMYDLLRQILPLLKTDLTKYIKLSEKRLEAYNNIATHDSINGQIIKDLRGNSGASDGVATFSFDGVNKGIIALGNMFDPEDPPEWGYRFSDKNGNEVKKNANKGDMSIKLDDDTFYTLYEAAAASDVSTGLNLYIDFMGTGGEVMLSSIINIINSSDSPYSVSVDDFSDRINGVNDETRWYWRDPVHPWKNYMDSEENKAEYLRLRNARTLDARHTSPQCRFNGGTWDCGGADVIYRDTSTDKWKTFGEEEPNTSGEQTYTIRKGASGTTVYTGVKTLTFTKDNSSNSNRCYSVDGITIVDFSSQVARYPVTDAFNGDLSLWWADNGTVQKSGADTHWTTEANDRDRYVTVKFDSPIWLTAVQYTAATQDFGFEGRAAYASGTLESGEIYGSMDGVEWIKLYEFSGLTYANNSSATENKMLDIPEASQQLVQYVKIHATKTYTRKSVLQKPQTTAIDENGIFSARGFTFFQDATKNPDLTGVIRYSTEDPTNRNVTAQLVNLSTQEAEIIGDDTVVFTENGEHTFHFVDEVSGKEGWAKAVVDWIDKEAPKAHVEYSTKDPTTGSVIAELIIDEKGNERQTLEMNVNGDWVSLTDIDADLELDPTDKRRKYAVSPYEATMSENGTLEFMLRDLAGNYATYEVDVSWICSALPDVQVVYSTNDPTNGNVTATLVGVSGDIFPVGDGSLTHVFEDNGEFVFEFRDAAGNEGSTLAAVDWIDRTPPTAHVEYSTTDPTKGPVTATLVADGAEEVTILGGGESHTFMKNGVYVFKFRDRAGNIAEAEARVTWIASGAVSDDSGGKPGKPAKPSKPGKP